MDKHKLNTLSNELRQAGAHPDEITPLTHLADSLQGLRRAPAPSPARHTVPPSLLGRKLLPALAFSCLGLAAGAWLIISAQAVLPGSWLYPVKRVSEQAAVIVNPDFRATIMMRRAQEVQQLVAAHADSHTVLATLAAYQSDAAAYKFGTANYAAFEYCKTSLQQAETQASPAEQQAIKSTIAGLQDV